jgi:hypothetical protein
MAGLTYGGLAYLGCSHIVEFSSIGSKIAAGIFIIGSNTLANGGVFCNAWIRNLRKNNLFNSLGSIKSRIIIESLFVIPALFGLGCAMTLGALGLIKSVDESASITMTILSYTIAFIGFLGEAPFAMQQGRVLAHSMSQITKKLNAANTQEKNTLATVADRSSLILYTIYSACATYTDIGDYSIGLRVLFALGSTYLSLISCLEEKTTEETKNFLDIKNQDVEKSHRYTQVNGITFYGSTNANHGTIIISDENQLGIN